MSLGVSHIQSDCRVVRLSLKESMDIVYNHQRKVASETWMWPGVPHVYSDSKIL